MPSSMSSLWFQNASRLRNERGDGDTCLEVEGRSYGLVLGSEMTLIASLNCLRTRRERGRWTNGQRSLYRVLQSKKISHSRALSKYRLSQLYEIAAWKVTENFATPNLTNTTFTIRMILDQLPYYKVGCFNFDFSSRITCLTDSRLFT